MQEQEIRPYGPGKFDTIMDSLIWDSTLDGGPDEEMGSVQEQGWYGLLTAPLVADSFRDQLTVEERALLERQAGCIISEDSQGFVCVEYYESSEELKAVWDSLARR